MSDPNYDHYMDGAKDGELIANLRCEIERLQDEILKLRSLADRAKPMIDDVGIETEDSKTWMRDYDKLRSEATRL